MVGDCEEGAVTIKFLGNRRDQFSVMTIHMSSSKDINHVIETFNRTFDNREDMTRSIVHNNQKFKYRSYEYHDMPPTVGVRISMYRRDICLDTLSMRASSYTKKRRDLPQ